MTMTRKTWYKVGPLVQQPDFISKIWKIEKRKKAGLEARMKSRWCGSYRTNSIMSLWLMTSKRTTLLCLVFIMGFKMFVNSHSNFYMQTISLNIFRSREVTTNYKSTYLNIFDPLQKVFYLCTYFLLLFFRLKQSYLVYYWFKKWRDKSKVKIGCWIYSKNLSLEKKIQYDSKIF